MRALILALAVVAPAAPAAAQDPFALQHLQNEIFAQQQILQQRAVAQHNDLMALEARLRAEQSVTDLIILRQAPRLAGAEAPRPPPAVAFDTSQLPGISDERLAASNAAVRAASQNRR